MMTRFDNPSVWITGCGEVMEISHLETTHLLNIVKMLYNKPTRIMSMLIHDIEQNTTAHSTVPWSPINNAGCLKKESIQNVTKMSIDELRKFAFESALGKSLLIELQNRGVNIENYLQVVVEEDASSVMNYEVLQTSN